jgi:predicted O-methyltransferase YrrM
VVRRVVKVGLFSKAWNNLREYEIQSIIRAGRNIFLRKTFKFWERIGLHITPVHFYQPIPDTKDLILDRKRIWGRSGLVGIDMNDKLQLKFLREIFPKYYDEYAKFDRNKDERRSEYDFYFGNASFESVDAEVLYCMIRHFKPSKVIEIGSGFSTLLIAQASRYNRKEGKDLELNVIDPYPMKMIENIPEISSLIKKRVQEIDFGFFQQLGSGDVLFIDSSHVVKIGSDVNYLYLEMLPRLKEGVVVHAHDIFIPMEYPEDWILREHTFWTEQYLLQAFLIYNFAFEILWGGHYMHINYPKELKSTFPSYDPKNIIPGSFWIMKKEVKR